MTLSPAMTRWMAPILAVGLVAPLASTQNSARVDFDSGPQGWSINGHDDITVAGGNLGAHLRFPDPIDTTGIAVRNDSQAAFLGDYAAKGDVTLSLDVKVDYIQNFGLHQSRELVVILYDDDAPGPSGPAAVWASMGVLVGTGMNWTTMSVDVTDAYDAAMPAGWYGRGDEDPVTYEPILPAGSTWASVLAGVDRIEFTTFVPGYFFSFAHYDVSVDNISMEPMPAKAWTSMGAALAGSMGEPRLQGAGDLSAGSVNSLDLTQAAPGAAMAYIMGLEKIEAPFKGGTLIPKPLFMAHGVSDPQGEVSVAFGVASGMPAGVEIYVQVAIHDGAAPAGLALSNALRGVTP